MRFLRKFIHLFLIPAIMFLACEDDSFEKPEAVIIDLEATDCSIYGGQDGAVSSSIIGGVPPYQYFWSNGATTENITGLSAGQYTLKVIYGEGGAGISEKTVIVSEPQGILNVTATIADVTWYGGDDGSINISVMSGNAPYSYQWLHDEEEKGAMVSGLKAGLYEVTITDSSPKPIIVTRIVEVGEPEFICGIDSVADVDGNKYPTVKVGDQCWTATNLVTRYNPNNPSQPIDGRFCKGTNCLTAHGAHYTWNAVMNGESGSAGARVQGICPKGWHLPSREEWKTFNSYLSIDGNGGPGTNVPNKIRGTDSSSGFDALYAGNWGYDVFTGDLAVFWTSTPNENQPGRAYYRLVNNFPLLGEGHEDIRTGMSCRCVLDE